MNKRLMLIGTALLLSAATASAQKRVTGRVVDTDGQPIAGASVRVQGHKGAVATDANGNFTLSGVSSSAKKISIAYIGKETQIVNIGQNLVVTLKDNDTTLGEAMVIAYGKTTKAAFTGSAAEIKAEDITNHIASSATSALVGAVPGIQATTSSGEPGSSPTIRIRGIGSVSASSNPLYIVDGAPYEAGIATLNPADIESISVQKDASASAIYGARGANGVIIITTKRARQAQDAKVTFDAKWGSNSRLVPQYDVIDDVNTYYETHFKALYNSKYYHGSTASEAYEFANSVIFDKDDGGLGYRVHSYPEGENLIGRNGKINPNATLGWSDGTYYYMPDNWYDDTFHNSFRQEYNVNVNGSTGKLNYYASVGYLQDGGMVNNSELKRYTARTNVDYQAKKWLKLSTSLSYTHTDMQSPNYDDTSWGASGNLFYVTNTIAPIYPLYVRNADGSIKTDGGRVVYDRNQTGQARSTIVGNAVQDNEFNTTHAFRDIFQGQWDAQITPIKDVTLDANLVAYSSNQRNNYLLSQFASASSVDGATEIDQYRTFTVNQRYTGNYNHTFADVHHMDVLLGYEQYKYKYQTLSGYNDHLYDPYIGELNNATGTSKKSNGSYTNNYMTEGIFGRVMYDYDNKYFVNASLRRDASSAFAPGHRWGTFGSFGLAWQMNRENFLRGVSWIDLLKLKLSYGVVGNDNLGSYYYWADRYSTAYNEETGSYSITQIQKGNEELTWETHRDFNLGVDFAFLHHRLSGTVEFYNQKTVDLLWSKELPLSAGTTVQSFYTNIGTMVNRGVEISLEGVPVRTKDIEWSINLNATFNHNEILELDPSAGDGVKGSSRILREGGSVYNAYLVQYAGVDHETGEGMWYKDVYYNANGEQVASATADGYDHTVKETTKVVGDATQYDCGTTLPTVYGGFGTTLKLYGFDLSAQFSYQLGGKIYDGGYQALMHNGLNAGNAMHKDLLNAWSETNKDSNIPRLSTAKADDPGVDAQTPQDRFLTSSNYLCLNNLTLGYTLPAKVLSRLHLSNLRVYVAGENLFLLTKRKGLDPRYNYGLGSMTSGSGLSTSSYTGMRTITGGLTLTF